MSSQLTVTETTELLNSLKGTVHDFAAAEEKLVREFRTKGDAAQKRLNEETAAHEAQLATQISGIWNSRACATWSAPGGVGGFDSMCPRATCCASASIAMSRR